MTLDNCAKRETGVSKDDKLGKRIEHVAIQLFQQNNNVSISSIAKAAHIGISSIYSRYEDKEDLIGSVMLNIMQEANNITKIELDRAKNLTISKNAFHEYLFNLVEINAGSMSWSLNHRVPAKHGEKLLKSSINLQNNMKELLQIYIDREYIDPGITIGDIHMCLEAVQSLRKDPQSTQETIQRTTLLFALGITSKSSIHVNGLSVPEYTEWEIR